MLVYNFFNELLNLIISMSPYLLFGFLLAGVLSIMISKDTIGKNLGDKKGFSSILKAGLFGIPLPLCSCSVIPVAASFKKHGASKGAITSFLLSTPQTGVDSIMVTYGLLGPLIALVRPFIALITGVIGGIVVHTFDKNNIEEDKEPCHAACCKGQSRSTIVKILEYAFITLPRDIARPLIIGLIVAALISLFFPPHLFDTYVGDGIFSMLFMIVIGIPLYICATASIPIALALMYKGATLGAAIVFLMVGPATNTTSLITMIKIVGKKSTILILTTLIFLSIIFGISIDYLGITYLDAKSSASHMHHYSMVDYMMSIMFIGIILFAALPKIKKKS